MTRTKARTTPAAAAAPAAAVPTFADLTGPGHRCSICCRVYPVLVDDVLCIRCDAMLYPIRVGAES